MLLLAEDVGKFTYVKPSNFPEDVYSGGGYKRPYATALGGQRRVPSWTGDVMLETKPSGGQLF